ncbi:MAG: hypothetical protein V3V10_04780 [Planctomycetota bacterium]
MTDNLEPYGVRKTINSKRQSSWAWVTFDVVSGLALVVFSITILVGQVSNFYFPPFYGYGMFGLLAGLAAICVFPIWFLILFIVRLNSVKLHSIIMVLLCTGAAVHLVDASWYDALGVAV